MKSKADSIHRLINIRASHIIYWDGSYKFEGCGAYRMAYEAIKVTRYMLDNFYARCNQGEILDGNYGKGQG